MRQDIEILPDNRLFPTVMNINQGQNKLDTALYSMKNYVVNEVDLSTCDWYAVLMGVYGLDEVKLTHEVDEGVLKVRWDLNDYVTNIGQTLTYQIVAKNSDAAVYYSNKGIILNSQSIHADEFIVSNYPSILRQWEEYMKDLGDSANLKAYVVMDLGNYIPVHERVDGKFYINRLTDYDYSCLIEDSDGNVITPSARGVSYDPSNTGILANNVQDAIDNLVKKSNGLNRFCVNEGNSTDGVEDLLGFSDSTLSFKVGGSYPNVIATKADGTTFTRNNISDESVIDFEDGVYNVFVDEQYTEILNNTILSEGQEGLAQPNDVLYNTITHEAKKYVAGGDTYTRITTGRTENIGGIASNGQVYVMVGGQMESMVWTSLNGIDWSVQNIYAGSPLVQVIYTGKSFIAVGNAATVLRSMDGINWTKVTLSDTTYNEPLLCITASNSRIFVGGANSRVFYSDDDGVTWKEGTRISTSTIGYVRTVCYGNGVLLAYSDTGHYYRSTDNGTTWEQRTFSFSDKITKIRFYNNKFLAVSNSGLIVQSSEGLNWTQSDTNYNVSLTDIGFWNNSYYCVAISGDIFKSEDLTNWETLPNVGVALLGVYENIICGNNATILNIDGVDWIGYSKVPVGSVTVSDGVITSVETFPYNYTQYNGLIATPSTFGLMRVAAPEDEVDCSCNDASITPSNLYDLSNYRRANTEYNVDDKVGCPYHHNLQLKCTVAGTTSSEALNTKGALEAGTEIVDGTVTWQVEELGSGGGLDGKITNCITEIPQDIKLELADGVLTLKAGSKVYVPNGFEEDGVTPKFDVVVVESDISVSPNDGEKLFFLTPNNKIFHGEPPAQMHSGGSAPTFTYGFWYDTTNNVVKFTSDGSTWTSGFSLPFAKGSNTSIDQVFNGFGYIGSTIFALPNVKALIPNGRNADGSLKNVEYVLNTLTLAQRGTNNRILILNAVNGEIISRLYTTVFESETRPNIITTGTQQQFWYNPASNICYRTLDAGETWVENAFIILGYVDTNSDSEVVNGLTTKLPFRAVDYSDRETVVGWGIPDYSAGVSKSADTEYTADVSGWIYASGSPKTGQSLTITIDGTPIVFGIQLNVSDSLFIPINRGSKYSITNLSYFTATFYPCKGVN